MERMGSIRVFGRDSKERAAGDFGPVHQAFHSDQGVMYIFRRGRAEKILPECSVAMLEVRQHEGIFGFEMPIEGRLCDLGDGHDFLGAGHADAVSVKEAVGNLQNSLPRIGILLSSHRNHLDTGRLVRLCSSSIETEVSVLLSAL